MTTLVIVESPTKAKTIGGFLPSGYVVRASMGHVRDLPASASEVPDKYKKEPWGRLGVNVEANFEPLYIVPDKKSKVVRELKELLKKADELILATDEDREGESIGWHLLQVLKPKQPVKRMVFHEITRDAIQKALSETRQIDEDLVHAQETRRILDRLVGYTVSPLLWKKIAPKLSAGRVQSVAVRLLVLRERERRAFRTGAYWDLKALLNKRPDRPNHRFEAQLYSIGDKRVATGRDFDEATGRIAANKKDIVLLNEAEARALRTRLLNGAWRVTELEEKDSQRSPYAPFTTSTLQQEANRKLGMGAKETMRVAQNLYENGYITYMRTDSVNLSDQAIFAARRRITELYGEEYLSPSPRRYQTKIANAQEAHEAIRPAGDQMQPADRLPLSGDERRLYDLIWKRTVASQMANARLKMSTATIEVDNAIFRATGRTVLFAGFFRAYVEGSDDPEAALDSQDAPLPPLTVGEGVDCRELEALGHETKPPARYTEATLVKALESEGVGRPSTYASIIDTILDRGYVFKQRKELVPTFTAFAVTELLERNFKDLVDVKFTANMEQQLDDIADGSLNWLGYLRTFYSGEQGLENQVRVNEGAIDPRLASSVVLGDLSPGVEIRIGQYGPFIAREVDGERRTASLPPDVAPADLTDEVIDKILSSKGEGPLPLGQDPASNLPVLLKVGPYGPYVQLGEDDGSKTKPKRSSLIKGMAPEGMTLESALQLLSLPRSIGQHPETGKPVQAGVGRFGPFVVHDGVYATVKPPLAVLEIGLEGALALLAEKAAGGSGGAKRTSSVAPLRTLGDHPAGGAVELRAGRYGPYVSHGKLNATLPKEITPEQVTLEQALALLAAKEAAGGSAAKKKAPVRKSGAAAKRTAAKPAAKKSPARKTAATKSASGKSSAGKATAAKTGAAKAPAAKATKAKAAAADNTMDKTTVKSGS